MQLLNHAGRGLFLSATGVKPRKTPYQSCKDVDSSLGDGNYAIDPDLTGNIFTAYCDMTTDGGERTTRLTRR